MTTNKEIVKFYYASAGWPVKKTGIATIQRNVYAFWPGLNKKMVRRHLEVRKSTVLGHVNAQQSGTQTTKQKEKAGEEKMEYILAKENDLLKKLVPSILQSRERQIGVHLVTFNELEGYIATDLYGVYCHTLVLV